MKRILFLLGLALFCGTHTVFGQFIEIRLSYKVILNPINGLRPADATDAIINDKIDAMNRILENYRRGYRLRQVGAIETIGGMNDPNGPSQYYDVNFGTEPASRMAEIQRAAMNNPNTYEWRNNAINLYIINAMTGGLCSFPPGNHIILVAPGLDAWKHLHEIGHYFYLYHTQGACSCVDPGLTGMCHTVPGDDFVNDTLPDLSSWGQNDIARWSYNNRAYAQLTAGERQLVDNTFFNLMSYHGSSCGQGAVTERLTERQLDRFADNANDARDAVVSGRTRFVDWRSSCPQPIGTSMCDSSPGGPFRRVVDGVLFANPAGGDIVLIRPGDYNERLTIFKPVTLRATRSGVVAIGRP